MKRTHDIFILLCPFLLSSCVYWGMYHFDDADLVWLSPYEEGDTILFTSVTDEVDTLVVKEKYIKDTYWPFMENEARPVMEAYGYLDIDIWHHFRPFYCGISITKEDTNRLRVSLPFSRIGKEYRESEIKMNRVELGGWTYDDVIVCARGNDRFVFPNSSNVQYYVWSKSKGLLQYKYLNGDVYTYYKKLPRKR